MNEAISQPLIFQGYVCFFDILGYTTLITRNELREISKLLSQVDHSVKVHHQAGKEVKVEAIAFGDSILVFCREEDVSGLIFVQSCALLFVQMFDQGLPLRGAISKGEIFKSGNIYAGWPIADARKYQEALDVSACVLTPDAERLTRNESFGIRFFKKLVVPLKHGNAELHVLNRRPKGFHLNYVAEKFAAHKKGCPMEVLPKIANTNALFERLDEDY